ncbi:hypothetical protein [Actinocrispum sp. NPDC049592]|uniref:DUF7507 domain-containing protein n=1 Tax=Actinocrispum sp. NPDC049592 TaxID=3154835 RepID=UPI0034139CD4
MTTLAYGLFTLDAEGGVRGSRLWGLAGVVSALLGSSMPPVAAAGPPPVSTVYDQLVYGDFAVIGNTVTQCPSTPGPYPVKMCTDAQNQVGSGIPAQNNGHPMGWADVDTSASTYNSSSAKLTIPAGAHIAYALLSWAGDTGAPAGIPCGRGMPKPPGVPRDQAVSLSVEGKASDVKPARYTEDGEISWTDQQFYSASADVTSSFKGLTGPASVMVGNVWTPQGYDCFGGWSLLAVWAFDGPVKAAPARRQVTVYDGHMRVLSGVRRVDARLGAIKAAGGSSRVGVAGYEGDWAIGGDQFSVNGHGYGENFFKSFADGRVSPNALNNMSVDAQTVDVSADVMRPGESGAAVSFTSGLDAYLIGGIAASSARPELAISTRTDRDTVHPGDDVTQSVLITNTGGAPAVDVRATESLGPACDQNVGRIEAGKSVTVTCTRAAGAQDFGLTAKVTGQSLVGDPLSDESETAVVVIDPAITVTKSASPTTVLNGQTVNYDISVRNTGNTALSQVSVDDKQIDNCDRGDLGTLYVNQIVTVNCSVVAGDYGFTNNVTVSGTDKIGKRVTADAHAAFAVVAPKIEFTVTPSTHAARTGDVVTFTISLKNPTRITLSSVRVDGTPTACARPIGTLAPGQEVVYYCDVRITGRLTTNLSVTATPAVSDQARQETVYATAASVVTLIPENPTPIAPPAIKKEAVATPTPAPAPTALLIAGLATLATFVTIGAISSTAGRPGK